MAPIKRNEGRAGRRTSRGADAQVASECGSCNPEHPTMGMRYGTSLLLRCLNSRALLRAIKLSHRFSFVF